MSPVKQSSPSPLRGGIKGGGSGPSATPQATGEPKLLSGGNPQIPKGHGNEPIQAYLAAMPGWKRAVGEQLDSLITAALPGVYKAVKWNSPLYGAAEGRWFLSLHCFNKYVKVTFFDGHALTPPPPVVSTQPKVRAYHIGEHDPIDPAQFTAWIHQAAQLPGEKM
ncbi:DUF1801 domain-containing protein [Devosia sp. 1566]|uniref:DUF1801 domain-containing protein n=1 Tax=Devosia sp. 1566 TaxID=2499144 RepID=UPI000FDA717A|nr:DUF1801 domain-containing protein [Devosia sp. 1566]